MESHKKILFVVNDPAFFLSHRVSLALAAKAEGYEVHIATAFGDAVKRIEALNLTYHKIHMTRSGKNPISELKTLINLYVLLKSLQPDLVHLVTIKPVLYGGMIARFLRIKAVVAAISGLGSVFVAASFSRKFLKYLVLFIYKISLGKRNIKVIFQNDDDREKLLSSRVIDIDKTILIKGSGVDLSLCPALEEPEGVPVVVMAARLLREKGVLTYVEAARIIHQRNVKAKFVLIGAPDYGNRSSVTREEIQAWVDEGLLEAPGFREDIPEIFSKSNIVVLPSYYGEGLPKVLIEAAACARAVVTTDNPGCRDAIEENVTGLLVPAKNPVKLADAIERLVLNKVLRVQMGKAGRELAEREYKLESVVKLHLSIYEELLNKQ